MHRRSLLTTGAALAAAMPASIATAAGPRRDATVSPPTAMPPTAMPPTAMPSTARAGGVATSADFGLVADSPDDQSQRLQRAIDQTAARGARIELPAGRFRVGGIVLRPGTRMSGAHGATVLASTGGAHLIVGRDVDRVHLSGFLLDGAGLEAGGAGAPHTGLLTIEGGNAVVIEGLDVRDGTSNGIALARVSGRVLGCTVERVGRAAIFSLDANGLEIAHNTISDCANNGILVWRSAPGEDGTIVTGNRIRNIRAAAGGSGQNGNGVNVYRAGNVLVSDNRITDCAYTAVRGNAASNIQIIANNTSRIGEVALYAEFAFEGAVIASNIVETAAAGISVTNFDEGGRLAVIQGNLVRNLSRREHEPVDKRGEGIAVEADAVVTGNVIENAATAGIVIGWGKYMRDVAATGNIVRNSRVGIMITADPAAGACLVANNMISGARDGAIRAMSLGVLTGPDLTRTATTSRRITIAGNVAVDTHG